MYCKVWLSRTGIILSMLLFIGCAMIASSQWDSRYGKPVAREFQPKATNGVAYYNQIKPLIEQRCTVCHGCYDAPCQLKLDSYQGLLRGANPEKVYDGARLLGASLTRMFEDASTTAEWRDKHFHAVINERTNTADANINASVMAQMLALKKANPLPHDSILPDSFDFNLDKKQYCPTIENFSSFAQATPLWGMPYALPGLNDEEHSLLIRWLQDGAQAGEPPQLPAALTQQIIQWETFFNGDTNKQQLVSRYIYEHLFLAQLFFPEATHTYFRLVRSSTPPGTPIARISTKRPYDEPSVGRVYYRLWQDPSSVVAKTHMPYGLNAERMQKWKHLFFETKYEVAQLPSYDSVTASNPFITFAELPVESRYRFMLDEAQFTIMNFIKGPVCRGQVALNVIQDHFWVFFLDPKTHFAEGYEQFIKENSKNLDLPAEVGNTYLPLHNWRKYADMQKEFLVAKAKFVQNTVEQKGPFNVNIIWNDEGGPNKNTALTIFRHNDSASVHQGLIGGIPKTAWVISYSLLERIHYLLAAGFDVYGNVSHQFLSRVYMDFLRMEGEMNFVEFLPKETQQKELAYWYRDADSDLNDYIELYMRHLKINTAVKYKTDNPKAELFQQLKNRVGAASSSPHNIQRGKFKNASENALASMEKVRGVAVSFLPQNTIIRVPELGVFSLLHVNAYSNLSSLFNEDKRHLVDEDTLIVAKGVIGAYPNAFMRVSEKDLPDFAARIQNLKNEADYQALRDVYGVRRSNPHFWEFSDELLQYYRASEPQEAALLDYNRLENR